jgi:MFS family permease
MPLKVLPVGGYHGTIGPMLRLKGARDEYPGQFWLMLVGMFISTIGASMIWPFLMIYVSGQLQLPLAVVASLMTLSAVMGLISSFIAGPIIDRAGRKWVMVLSLGLNALGYLLMSQAHTLPAFAVLMALNGAVNPLYRVGADAMMADLIPPEKRVDAYSVMRMSNNLGIAIGPAIGGVIATTSYQLAFYFAAAGLGTYSLLIALFASETLPGRLGVQAAISAPPIGRASPTLRVRQGERFGGYGQIFQDRPFINFIGNFILVQMCAALIWVLMAVYAKTNYGVPESQYGLVATTNALMVVFFQVLVTRITKRHPPLRILAVGAAFYTVATGGVALATGFWGFWIVMVVMTVGELILAPTSSTYAANRAPADKRGRYMGLYGLTWGMATGISALLGGVLNDTLGPRSTWIVGALIGLASVLGFLLMASRSGTKVGTQCLAPEPQPGER